MIMKRDGAFQELRRLAQVMIQGSLSQTTRTCGQPTCRCHRGERHGPHTYLTFRTADGRSSALYVPAVELAMFRQRVAAWQRFWKLATKLARENRAEIALRRRSGAGRNSHAVNVHQETDLSGQAPDPGMILDEAS